MRVASALLLMMLLLITFTAAQNEGRDILGAHDLSSGASPVSGSMSAACLYCHAPHSGIGKGPLWGQTLSSQTYSMYSSETIRNTTVQPVLGETSTLCLSCHDGTVAPGQMVPYGKAQMSGTMTSILSTKLEGSHPFSLKLPIQDSATLVPSIAATQTTADSTHSVKLIKGNVECTSCHNPHNQGIDKRSMTFLVRDNANGALCLSCHETKPRTVNARENALAQWTTSIHANSAAQVAPTAGLGGYSTVAEFACLSCHVTHNASGTAGLLRNPVPPAANIDSTSQSCIMCHNGSDKLLQPVANVFAEFEKKGHPFPTGGNTHSPSEPVVLVQNRHATCVDCHNAHIANQVTTFSAAPGLRPSQNGVAGVAADGSSLTGMATKQYENCLRCHGNSSGKQSLAIYGYLPSRAVFAGDPLNLITQFDITAASSHPVMRDSTSTSQPSLLGSMWDLSGNIQNRAMGTRIFCTDCHNSDDNREFGGTGPNGPHGSKNDHILERPYTFSQVAAGTWPSGGPGSLVINLTPNPALDPGSGGPYSMCAKCHNLNNVVSDVSFSKHSKHILTGISCSVCHSAHGVPAAGAGSGQRLINFDVNVVRPNNGVLSYDRSTNTCTLTCHMVDHEPNGTVTPAN
ncbi:MAG TPA: cytochrome c3 family protein [Clostridia bacterium]|nr:cytochrome c3 family protein [Clostridia bacterium]